MQRTLPILILLLLTAQGATARDLASVPWTTFKNKASVVAKAQLVKAELKDFKMIYTFRLTDTIKGAAPREVVITREMRESFPAIVGSTGYLFLTGAPGVGYKFPIDERCFWPIKAYSNPRFYAVFAVMVPDTLVRDIPKSLKVTVQVMVRFPSGHHKQTPASIYPVAAVESYLKRALK